MTENLLRIISGLNSGLRLSILKLLCENDLTSQEIFLKMKNKVLYRQYIHRELEILRNAGVIKKYYDEETNKLYYKITCHEIIINLSNQTVDWKLIKS